ncbi:hypothetical protein [Natronoflexus pectinivorans]|uniref:Universal stress protein family protein n=1 Tax=Natronoflexus pectinivorans TaxID=682526 RepID=A0A4R2GMR5_9BACT|nr:hypothetical protein [Natronoflexus pectinivorans]TCO09719.1 hypothetical protein EV194_102145 [Natronoflexus pectinivorans]
MLPNIQTTIIVACAKPPDLQTLRGIVFPIAKVFGASVTFLLMNDQFSTEYVEKSLTTKKSTLRSLPAFRFISFPYNFNYNQLMGKNSHNEEAIMIIFPELPSGFPRPLKELRFMLKTRKLRLPYMILPKFAYDNWFPSTVIIPIGYDRTDKETAIWASYFGRFSGSRIIVLKANEKEQWAKNNTDLNIRFVDKLFKETGTQYVLHESSTGSGRLPKEAIKLADESGNSLVVLSTTKHYGAGHYITGPDELHIIKNKSAIPVLCVNPVKNAYVLCK